MKRKIALQGLLMATLALSLVSPARADKQICESVLGCMFVIPAAVAYAGALALVPAPPLVQAMEALKRNDLPKLKHLLERHQKLTQLSPEQAAVLAKMEANPKGEVERRYVLSLPNGDAEAINTIDAYIRSTHIDALRYELKTSPRLASVVDNGYALLSIAAGAGNLEAVRLLLDAGVRADSHKSGALSLARREDVRQLLTSRGATPAKMDTTQKPGSNPCDGADSAAPVSLPKQSPAGR